MDKLPNTEFNKEETRASRVMIDSFLHANPAKLFIQHDLILYNTLRKSPSYYD